MIKRLVLKLRWPAVFAALISIALTFIPYPLDPNRIAPDYVFNDSEYLTAYGMPEPIYIGGDSPLAGWTLNWVSALFTNWFAILFWIVALLIVFGLAARSGMVVAYLLNKTKQPNNAIPRMATRVTPPAWVRSSPGWSRATGSHR